MVASLDVMLAVWLVLHWAANLVDYWVVERVVEKVVKKVVWKVVLLVMRKAA